MHTDFHAHVLLLAYLMFLFFSGVYHCKTWKLLVCENHHSPKEDTFQLG